MPNQLKTFSIVINWQDGDSEQGDYGTVVRAANEEEAEAKARAEMRAHDMANYGDEDDAYDDREYGSVVECHEGWIWKAPELETALRGLMSAAAEAADANADDDGETVAFLVQKETYLSLQATLDTARRLLAELDKEIVP